MTTRDRTILLVEDDANHIELIRRNAPPTDDIRVVEDGDEALDYLFQRGEYADPTRSPKPTVILLDLRLGKVDGLHVLKTVKVDEEARRLDLHKIPVVIVTTSQTPVDIASAYDMYVNSYLVKPVEASDWKSMMTEIDRYWFEYNRP